MRRGLPGQRVGQAICAFAEEVDRWWEQAFADEIAAACGRGKGEGLREPRLR